MQVIENYETDFADQATRDGLDFDSFIKDTIFHVYPVDIVTRPNSHNLPLCLKKIPHLCFHPALKHLMEPLFE